MMFSSSQQVEVVAVKLSISKRREISIRREETKWGI
tara:strand:- start:365 stop:472 length:108 start_codon:yes stop_codon:yes gene_type:complete